MLRKCGDPDCNPVEQIRGEMGHGDYKDAILNQRPDINAGMLAGGDDHYKYVELDDANRSDFRICCMHCGRATGWAPKDFPNMPDAGADWVRKRWAEACAGS